MISIFCTACATGTFGIPILDCPMDTFDMFSTNVKCNESGMHAIDTKIKRKTLAGFEIIKSAFIANYENFKEFLIVYNTYVANTQCNGALLAHD